LDKSINSNGILTLTLFISNKMYGWKWRGIILGNDHIEMNFDVHASLLFQLGEQLITDDITAISELVKNSYDADASYVDINIDPDWSTIDYNGTQISGKIEVKDNGIGMDLDTVKRGWLTISRSEKRKMKQRGDLTGKFSRVPLGDKGVGRLSAQRLGSILRVVTKKRDEKNEIIVDINWNDFHGDVTLSEIRVKVQLREVESELEKKSYTNLIITGLKNVEHWISEKEIAEFETRLSKITSPFDFNRKFLIKARVGNRKIELYEVSKEFLKSATVRYTFTVDETCIEVLGFYRYEFFPNATHDQLEEFAQFIANNKNKFNIHEVLSESISFEYHEKIPLTSLGGLNLSLHPGPFEGTLFDYSLDSDAFKNANFAGAFEGFNKVSELRNYVRVNKGVKIYRDDFRVFPYGDEGSSNDWLRLGEKFTSGSSYYFLKPANVVGYIKLTGENNKNIREKTDREGFVDDAYSRNFFTICNHLVSKINTNRENLRRSFVEYTNLLKQHMEARTNSMPSYQIAKNTIIDLSNRADNLMNQVVQGNDYINAAQKTINESKEKVLKSITNEHEKNKINDLLNELHSILGKLKLLFVDFQSNFQIITMSRASSVALVAQIEQTMNQVQEVIELAGLGITAETLSHELFTIINYTKDDTQSLRKYFRENYESDIKIEAFFDSIIARSDALRKQISYLAPGFKNVRLNKERINISELIKEHTDFYSDRLRRNNITININDENTFVIYANKGMLYQVLDNLYNNAEFWLNYAFENRQITTKKYYIDIGKRGLIYIWDSGMGIDKNIEDRIFDPFLTTRSEGRGLGLYIITRILGFHECSIRLMELKNEFNNRYKFCIDLSRILTEG
jgi:hypothetical protein